MADAILINRLSYEELNLELYNLIVDIREKYRSYGKPVKGTIYISIDDGEPAICTIRGGSNKKDVNNEIIIQRCVFNILDYKKYPEEFKFVIAHEFSHIYNDDFFYLKISWVILVILPFMTYALSYIILNDIKFSYFTAFLSVFIEGRLYMCWRRKMETRCDKEAVTITKNVTAMINYLKIKDGFHKEIKVEIKAINKIIRFCWRCIYIVFGNSHPNLPDRLENAEKWEKELRC